MARMRVVWVLLLAACAGGDSESGNGSGTSTVRRGLGPETSRVEAAQAALPAAVPAAVPVVAEPGAAPWARRVLLHAPWGAGLGEVGLERPDEGSPSCPNAAAIDGAGDLWVLDQVNERIQVFPAAAGPRVVPLVGGTAADLAVVAGGAGGGRFWVLDRDGREVASLLDGGGGVLAEIPLAGPGIPEAGGVTGLFVSEGGGSEGVRLEYDHRWSVRIAAVDGAPDPLRRLLRGRLSGDGGAIVTAALGEDGRALLLAHPAVPIGAGGWAMRARVEAGGGRNVVAVHGLEADAGGTTYAMVLSEGSGGAGPAPAETLHVFAPDATEVARIDLEVPAAGAMPFRPLRARPGGGVVVAACMEDGLLVEEVTP